MAKYKPIIVFLINTILLSLFYYLLIISSGTIKVGWGKVVAGLMWAPGIAALITLLVHHRSWSELGWKWGKNKYQLWSYGIAFGYVFLAYLGVWIFGGGKFYNQYFVDQISDSFGISGLGDPFIITIYVILFGLFGTIQTAAKALGEEIGWRGFLAPELYKNIGFTKASIISGFIWGIWHLPGLLLADYNSGTPSWYAMTCFMVLVVSVSFTFTWLRIKSGSLWTAVILHASHNVFVQQIFSPLTQDTGNTAYYIDEFGVALPIVSVGMAVYFWSRRKELDIITK